MKACWNWSICQVFLKNTAFDLDFISSSNVSDKVDKVDLFLSGLILIYLPHIHGILSLSKGFSMLLH